MQTRQRARTAAAARFSTLAEQVLHICALELQKHLHGSTVGALRLVCKSARAALDASLQELTLSFKDDPEDSFERVQAPSTHPVLQRLLASCGRRWPAVITLSLQGCGPVSLTGCTLPPHLKALNLKDSRPVSAFQRRSSNAFDPLSSIPATLQCFNFTNVAVEHCQSLCQALIPALPRLRSLTSLILSDLKYDEHLCGLRGALRPGHTTGTGHGGGEVVGLFAALSALQALTRLELQGLDALDDTRPYGRAHWAAAGDAERLINTEARLASLLSEPLAASLHHLTRLEMLSLEMPMYRGGAQHLAPALQRLARLRELDLGNCELGMPTGRVRLNFDARQDEIEEAAMAHSGLGALRGALAALTALTRLGLAYNDEPYVITALPQSMPQLLSLDLSTKASGGFPVKRWVMVAATLRRYSSLTKLILRDNPRMSHGDSTALVEALTELTNLHTLYVGGGRGGSLKVAAFLTPVLQHLRQLEDLSLSCALWRAKDERCRYHGREPADSTLPFWCAVAELTALTRLDLNRIRNTGDFVNHMAQVLPRLTNLQHLDISNNDLDDRDASVLAPVLRHLVRLTELQAGNRLWGARGMGAVRRSVASLTRLQVLVLEGEATGRLDKYLYEDVEGWPYMHDGFSSEETVSRDDWSSEDVGSSAGSQE